MVGSHLRQPDHDDVMVRVLVWSVVDRGFTPQTAWS